MAAEQPRESRTLEDRIRAIEDRLEIYNLIAGHPPSADTGADYFARAIYTEDGIIDLGGDKKATGNTAIAASLKAPGHQAAIAGGLAHFAGLPHIALAGELIRTDAPVGPRFLRGRPHGQGQRRQDHARDRGSHLYSTRMMASF